MSLQKKVFSGRHLRDVAFHMSSDSSEWVASKPTLLVLYTPKCEDYFKRGKIKETGLPPTHIVTYLKHDYQSFPPFVWYKLYREENDLVHMFDLKRCPTAVFIREGNPVDEYESWTTDSKMTFDKWLWNLLKTEVFVGSRHSKPVEVSFHGPNGSPQVDSVTLSSGGMKKVQAYIGYKMYITLTQPKHVLYSTTIDLDTAKEKISIDSETKPVSKNFKEWKAAVTEKERNAIQEISHREYNILYMHIRTFKQPLLLGYFTDDGYTVTSLNDHLYEEIITFWDHHFWEQQHSKYIQNASLNEYDPWVECKDNPIKTLKLSTALKANVSDAVKELAKEWLEMELEVVNVRGIHHFKEGHYMKQHVSDANNVFTAWIILEKEKHDSHHYFEVINYQTGRQEIVDFIPGEVFMFESSTLILSMHEPLKAEQFFTFISLSLKPKKYWPWSVAENGAAIEVEDVMGTRLQERLDDLKRDIIVHDMPQKIDYDHTEYHPVTRELSVDTEDEENSVSNEQEVNDTLLSQDDLKPGRELEQDEHSRHKPHDEL